MFEFEKPRIDVMDISEDGTYGKFVVEPLERGYGTTLEILSAESCYLLFLVLLFPASRLIRYCMSLQRFMASKKTFRR